MREFKGTSIRKLLKKYDSVQKIVKHVGGTDNQYYLQIMRTIITPDDELISFLPENFRQFKLSDDLKLKISSIAGNNKI
jgi:hypothetical protein